MSNKLTQTQISTTQSRPDGWLCPGPSSLDCDKMNLENFSRKVVAGCIPPRDIGWILVITHYTGYLPRVLTDRHQHHLKVPRPHTSHLNCWQEAGGSWSSMSEITQAAMTCSDWQDIRWSASSEWEVTSINSNDRLTLAVYLSEKSPVTTQSIKTVGARSVFTVMTFSR